MKVTIKHLTATDLPLAKALLRRWAEDDGKPNARLPADRYLEQLLSRPDFHVFVALDGERVIGGASAYELPMFGREITELFLYEIGVEEAYRRRGVAANLVEAIKELCAEKGLPVMFVATEAENRPAKALYEKTGGELEEVAMYVYERKE